jgi:hypothetical protein
MSTQYRLVQSGKTASGGCSAGPRFVRAVAPRIIYFLEAQNIGMKINCKKTKEMRVNPKHKDRLYLGGYEIEEVNKFCCLGCMVSRDGRSNEDIKSQVNTSLGQLRPIWTSHQTHRRTKLRIFKSNVMSVLLYGCETWKATQ